MSESKLSDAVTIARAHGVSITDDVIIGAGTKVWHNVNLYGCKIGRRCNIGSFVEIGTGVTIGDECKIEAYSFIPQGVHIGNRVFIGPHVVFTNDKYPRIGKPFKPIETFIEDGVAIGANCTILSGIKIGHDAMIGAGTVVTRNVPADCILRTVFTRMMRKPRNGE